MRGPFEDWALELMADMSAEAGRQLNWNVMLVNEANHADSVEKLRAGDVAKAKGGKVVALTVPVNLGVRLCFASGFGLDALPDWEKHMFGDKDQKIAMLSEPQSRNHLNELAQQPGPLRGLADWQSKVIYDTTNPENEQYQGRAVSEIAETEGKTPWDALCDIVVADELQTSFGTPAAKESTEDWKARGRRDPRQPGGDRRIRLQGRTWTFWPASTTRPTCWAVACAKPEPWAWRKLSTHD